MISTRRNDKKAGAAEHVFAALAWFFVWEIAALIVGKDLILPGPLRVAVTLAGLIGQGSFWLSIGMTLIRILGGYLLGLLLACLLAVLTSFVRIADILLSPAIRIIRAVPVASFIILALLWVGRSRVPVLISMMMVVPVIWGNLSEAIASTDGKLLEMGRAYRFGKMKIFRFIYLPSVLPSLEAGCLTAMGLAWKSGIAAEVLAQPKNAIGTNVYNSKVYLETPELFAWTLTVIGLSLLIEHVIRRAVEAFKSREGAT